MPTPHTQQPQPVLAQPSHITLENKVVPWSTYSAPSDVASPSGAMLPCAVLANIFARCRLHGYLVNHWCTQIYYDCIVGCSSRRYLYGYWFCLRFLWEENPLGGKLLSRSTGRYHAAVDAACKILYKPLFRIIKVYCTAVLENFVVCTIQQ